MMRRLLRAATLVIIVATLAGCGGSGAGSSSQPTGVNAGVVSVVQVLPVQTIAQTNTYIPIKARILDGNGNLLPNIKVTFTNLSLVGSLSSTSATTNQQGIATVNLFSSTAGFSTIQAEVATASGMDRDKKTVFFTDFSLNAAPTLTLDVDGNNNGIYNEPSDYILFETPDDNEVLIRATLKSGGAPVAGSLITFGADTVEGTFPLGNTAVTNNDGQASVLVKVDPIVLRNFNTVLNITAVSDYGAANIVSLFLEPVTVNTVSVTADSTTIDSGGTAAISALVSTTAGSTVPDGTAVDFAATSGNVTPFSQTTDGVATATFTAPTLAAGSSDRQVRITASSGGKSGSVTVTVVAPQQALTVVPGTITVVSDPTKTGTAKFTISGGTGSYTATSSDPSRVYNGTVNNGVWTGSTVTATIAIDAAPGDVTLTVTDSSGATTTATVTILGSTTPGVVSTLPINGALNVPVASDITVKFNMAMDPATITGGSFLLYDNTANAPFITSCDPATAYISSSNTAVLNIGFCGDTMPSGHQFTVTLTTAITSSTGTPLAAPYTFIFTTQ
jgi:adhesin/invasin